MIILCFLIGIVIYSLSALISYSGDFKLSSMYLPSGMALGALGGLLWLQIARFSLTKEDILINGIVWDSIILFCFLGIPWWLYNIDLTGRQTTGIILVVFGLFLAKI